jgi:hypothetical protein
MSKEISRGLGDFVDKRRTDVLRQSEGAAASESVLKEWKDDNVSALKIVRTAIEGLAFPDIVERKREILRDLPGYRDTSMEIRTVNWVPDSTETTISAPEPRIRAVQGHIALVSGRSEGVNGNFLKSGEHSDSAFYVLGMAIEDGASLSLHKVIGPGLEKSHKVLYGLLTADWYEFEVAEHNNRGHRDFFGNLDLSVELLTSQGLEVPVAVQERSNQKRAAMEKARLDADADFAKRMTAVSEKIIEGPIPHVTKKVHELLLGVEETPTIQKKRIMRIFGKDRSANLTAAQKPTYVKYKEPLLEWSQAANQLALDDRFDTFLATNPAITKNRIY